MNNNIYKYYAEFKTYCQKLLLVYLVGTGQPQSVEHRNEHTSRDEEAQDVSATDEPVLSAVRVDLCRDAYDGHGRLE